MDMKTVPLCHRVSLHGRGTMVLKGSLPIGDLKKPQEAKTQVVAVKISHPEVRRTPERHFIDIGRQISGVREHLPEIYHAQDFGDSTGSIRVGLGRDKGLERKCRIIVFELLQDITSLTDPKQVAQVWRDCLIGEFHMVSGVQSADFCHQLIAICGRRGVSMGTSASIT